MKKTKLYSIISFLVVILFLGAAAQCNQRGIDSATETAAVEAEESDESSKSETSQSSDGTLDEFDENLVGTWVSDCLIPDPDSPWSEKHQFVIKSDGSAVHTRWSSSGHECVPDETMINNYKLTITSPGQVEIKDTDLNQTIYDIYEIDGSTLLFGHGFRGDSDAMQVKDNNFGLNPETRFTTLNEFIVYKK